ncbi:alpha-mannosidase [Lapillicoccus jejuensis]|uniref:Alpha-mannosidase n=1 Tax=Lapillicoccus jejuensis TaxID=402171 RepID=A0A542E0A2_9MICO|nr:glycoside hydrolase family 38 C-terminal domain-containing protein [Lapillicoccus jejuensis]TQJ08777.1 alpha-mannosidase [Lapillicoccus jejuensis]
MHDTVALIEARIRRSYSQRVARATHTDHVQVTVETWDVPDEPVPFAQAVTREFAPLEAGTPWGRPWGTTWFRISGTVPSSWAGDTRRELLVDLGWVGGNPGFQSEGLCYTPDGTVIKALEPRNSWVPVTAAPGEDFTVLVEAASNPDVGGTWTHEPTPMGDLATAPRRPLYTFASAALAVLDEDVFALERDMWVLIGVMDELPASSPRRAGILRALERAVDVLDPDDVPATAKQARIELAPALASPAAATSHRLVGVGHAHIDSAWLWPVRETKRKVARTFSNVLDLMDRYDDFVFAASSAQQYAWLKEDQPEVFERLRKRVADGRFVPVGGMWVESDTNLPGGEAMARQFVAGKRFFLEELGVETDEVWLPDSFGYSGALPQIVAASASHYFLTQKISWNETNVMPHHTFQWEGIDGTRVFTHFPPVDTYNAELTAVELARAERQHAERGVSDLSLVPFGYGDGGGGPTREMVETARRKADLEGSPKVQLARPDEFFGQAAQELPEPAVWAGELYLEFHRGTYTSQARTKLGNRRCEHLLREAELWAATATVRTGATYPVDVLREAWETVLLQQFHDILPGSSIAWVYQVAEENYARVEAALTAVVDEAQRALAGTGGRTLVFNASPFAVAGVPALGAGTATPAAARVAADGDGVVLESDAVTARLDAQGHVVSLVDRRTGRDAIAPGEKGNELLVFRDTPNQWDAWDVDKAYERMPLDVVATTGVEVDGDTVVVRRTVSASTVVQRVRLSPDGGALEIETEVDWHEKQKLLKLAFVLDVHAETSASEIQFGHVRRATHTNTSWDMARFEISGHRWVRVDEPGFGVTLANDRVYGRDVTRRPREGGGLVSVVRESLLRAPLFPDPHADQGTHVFRHALRVGELLEGVAEGYRLNLPSRTVDGAAVDALEPLVAVEGEGIVVEAVKLAEDGSGDVVVRLYEARGTRARGRVVPGFDAGTATRTDLLERAWPEQPADALELDLRAFELVTLRLPRA